MFYRPVRSLCWLLIKCPSHNPAENLILYNAFNELYYSSQRELEALMESYQCSASRLKKDIIPSKVIKFMLGFTNYFRDGRKSLLR